MRKGEQVGERVGGGERERESKRNDERRIGTERWEQSEVTAIERGIAF